MIAMIVKGTCYNPERDITPVSQTGFIDLQTAFVNNTVPSQVVNEDSDYNGIDNPDSILGCPSDVFEAIDMESYIKDACPKSETDSASS